MKIYARPIYYQTFRQRVLSSLDLNQIMILFIPVDLQESKQAETVINSYQYPT